MQWLYAIIVCLLLTLELIILDFLSIEKDNKYASDVN